MASMLTTDTNHKGRRAPNKALRKYYDDTNARTEQLALPQRLSADAARSHADTAYPAAFVVAEVVRMTWQPIETAPKDGTPVMLWAIEACSELHGPSPYKGPVIGSWIDGQADFPGDDWWNEQGGVYYAAWLRASHWMPLPAPPEAP